MEPTREVPISTVPMDGQVPDHLDGVSIDVSEDDEVDRRLAEIEMAGEEAAIGFDAGASRPHLAPEVRYLHVSRTIHQLVTDRNRSVGIFLFVASVLVGASTALLNVGRDVVPMIPLAAIQYWCLPVTFGTLGIIGLFMSLILVRSRIGLIYEVAKMNVLLGLPNTRVSRVNPLSIFFLMHLLVVLLGGASAGFTAAMLAHGRGWADEAAVMLGLGFAVAYLAVLKVTYFVTIARATSDAKLDGIKV